MTWVPLQSDTKCNSRLSYLLIKASRNMFIVKSLWLHFASHEVVWKTFLSFVFRAVNFCWPTFCEILLSSIKNSSFSKRPSRWWSRYFSPTSLPTPSQKAQISMSLFKKILELQQIPSPGPWHLYPNKALNRSDGSS